MQSKASRGRPNSDRITRCLVAIRRFFPGLETVLACDNPNTAFPAHSQLYEYHRARVIIGRVRQLAILFLVLSLFGMCINFLLIPETLAIELANGLLLSGSAYVILIAQSQGKASIGRARVALAALFTISAVVFLFCSHVLKEANANDAKNSAEFVYALLPLVLLASEALFPMMPFEVLFLCDLPVLSLILIAYLAYANPVVPGFDDFPLLILLLLLSLIVGAGSYSQLRLMREVLRQSLRDPLTQALTRRSGELVVQLQFARAKRTHAPLAVAFLDVDNFKRINDRDGHESGDMVLRGVADFLRTRLREGDALIRWAGDEFLIVMPNATADDAVARLDSLSNAPCCSKICGDAVTWSCGAVQWSTQSGSSSWQELVAAADAKMYRAKRLKTGNVCELPQSRRTGVHLI